MFADVILPDRITVDVSALNIGDSIHVRDIKFPAGSHVEGAARFDGIFRGRSLVEEEPVVAEAEAAAAGPEVIKEKKEEGEAAAPAARRNSAGQGNSSAAKEKEQKK